MKTRLLFLFAMSAMIFAFSSCEKDKKYSLDADPRTITFGAAESQSKRVTITSENVDWTIGESSTASWVSLEKQQGAVVVTVDENVDATPRETKFTVESGNTAVSSIEITVKQDAAGHYVFDATPRSLEFTATETAEKPITVTAENVDWTVEVASGADWIIYEKASENTILVSARTNGSKTGREGKLTIISGINAVPNIDITITQAGFNGANNVIFTDGEANYWGDHYLDYTYNFDIKLYAVEKNDDGWFVGDGYTLFMDFFSEAPSNIRNPEIASGVYDTFDQSGDSFTAIPGEYVPMFDNYMYSYVTVVKDGDLDKYLGISGGKFTVEQDGENYTMVFELELSDGSLFYGTFDAPLLVVNNTIQSNLEDDVDFQTMTGGGFLDFYGDDFENGTYDWSVFLWSDGVFFGNGLEGSGDVILLQLLSPQEGAGTQLPAGRYTVNDFPTQFSALFGALNVGQKVGSWYVRLEDGVEASYGPFVIGGTIDVEYDNGIYNFQFDATDDIGYSIRGSYEGELEWTDMSAPVAPNAMGNRPAKSVARPLFKSASGASLENGSAKKSSLTFR